MFTPATDRIRKLVTLFPTRIRELEGIFQGRTNVYIDISNVLHWQGRLGWHIDFQRLKQLLDSFTGVGSVNIYVGTLLGNQKSEEAVINYQKWGYGVHTKPVKIISFSIDASSISPNSPTLLQQFIRKALLDKLDLGTIEFLNQKLADLNKRGLFRIQDKKCNFDVEIGRHMLNDFDKDGVETFVLWSGDSDFADPINQILRDGRRVYIFATTGRVSAELAASGAPIFDIKKIKEFICWPREFLDNLLGKMKSVL